MRKKMSTTKEKVIWYFFFFSGYSYPCIWEFLSPTTISINGGKMIICLTQPWALPKLDWNYITVLNIESVHIAKFLPSICLQNWSSFTAIYHKFTQRQYQAPAFFYRGFQLFLKDSIIKDPYIIFIPLAVHFLFRFPFSQYLSSKFNYKAYNPLI